MDGRAWGDELAERAFREATTGIDGDGQGQDAPKTGRRAALGATDTPATGPSDPPGPQNGSDGLPADDADRRLRAARFVADHWRNAILGGGDHDAPWRLAAHPLCMVIAALDGETDPARLGIDPDSHAAFQAAVSQPASTGVTDD